MADGETVGMTPPKCPYPMDVDELRETEFARMGDAVYLDHAGSTLYTATQVKAHADELTRSLFGNPHSGNPSSEASSIAVESARNAVLSHFNVSSTSHSVVFTSGATAALKLVAESFQYYGDGSASASDDGGAHAASVLLTSNISDSQSLLVSESCDNADENTQTRMATTVSDDEPTLMYLRECHTSAVGMREAARVRGIQAICITEDDISEGHDASQTRTRVGLMSTSLVVLPGQCNYSGRKYPLSWVAALKAGNARIKGINKPLAIMLDAAALASTSSLDLSEVPADFISLSFYKMFGLPTGLGALIVRNESSRLLRKDYFGGGAVDSYSATTNYASPRSAVNARLEDGTIPFLAIRSLKHGFDALTRVGGMSNVQNHTFNVTRFAMQRLNACHHFNGAKVVHLYCDHDLSEVSSYNQGPVVNFNMRRADGSWVGFAEVERLASIENIHLRTGCFCNAGACHKHLEIDADKLKTIVSAGFTCGSDMDVINGLPIGSIRISFGYMSNVEDVERFLRFIQKYFVETSPLDKRLKELADRRIDAREGYRNQQQGPSELNSSVLDISVSRICVFPIKSCGAFEVDEWELDEQGLVFDRHWMVVNNSSVCITQKQHPRLSMIKPVVNQQDSKLILRATGMSDLSIELFPPLDKGRSTSTSRVCNDKISGIDCGDDVAKWLEDFIGFSCRLIKQNSVNDRQCRLQRGVLEKADLPGSEVVPVKLSLANESQYLLTSESSMKRVNEYVERVADIDPSGGEVTTFAKTSDEIPVNRFRGNIVISGGSPFEEDSWAKIIICGQVFRLVGPCQRCQMVCVDQDNGTRTREPLVALSKFRRVKGSTFFGQHLSHIPSESKKPFVLRVGGKIDPLE